MILKTASIRHEVEKEICWVVLGLSHKNVDVKMLNPEFQKLWQPF